MIYLRLAWPLAMLIVLTWTFSAVAIQVARLLGRSTPEMARHLFHELKPFMLPATIVWPLAAGMLGELTPWTWVSTAMNVWNWWSMRNIDDDDDRWKRRRKKLAERVQVQAGRLVLVSGAPS